MSDVSEPVSDGVGPALQPGDEALIAAARAYAERAWAPLSNYKVGAALRSVDGRVFGGVNVEHIILSSSTCAERTALHTAIAEGARRFDAVAVWTASSPPASPCGVCRQAMWGWGVRRVIMANDRGEVRVVDLKDLLPLAFDLEGPVR